MQPSSDQALLKRAQQGNSNSYGEIVDRYQRSVLNLCYRMMGTRQDAEDMTQDAFIRAFDRLHTYDLNREFGPWVRTIAANLCLNTLQRKANQHLSLDEQVNPKMNVSKKTPEDYVQVQEQSEIIHQAVLELPPRHRAVIELRHYQALSYAEIAQALELPLSDVKSYLYRARNLLANKLEGYLYAE